MASTKQISVRLDDQQQVMLQQLLKHLNKQSPVNIATADVMRIALEKLYEKEMTTTDTYH